MKCISLWQPWSSLIVIGAKRCETRGWSTDYRGPLLIHAAKKWSKKLNRYRFSAPFTAALSPVYNIGPLPLGCIVGIADLVSVRTCVENGVVSEPEVLFGDFGYGRFAWKMENARRFMTPIPYKGWQGFFNVPDDVVAEQMEKKAVANG